jgi:carbon starvation protein CstA
MSLISSLASLLIAFGLGSAALALLRYNGGFMLSQLGIPSALMILAGLVYAGARLSGAGQGLGSPTLQRLDRMFCAGLLAMQGLYACLCRGVSTGGFICTGVLTAFYLAAWLASSERPGRFAWGLIALVWMAVLYRYFAPIPPMWLQPAGLPGAP